MVQGAYFRLILRWKQYIFQAHLALDNSMAFISYYFINYQIYINYERTYKRR